MADLMTTSGGLLDTVSPLFSLFSEAKLAVGLPIKFRLRKLDMIENLWVVPLGPDSSILLLLMSADAMTAGVVVALVVVLVVVLVVLARVALVVVVVELVVEVIAHVASVVASVTIVEISSMRFSFKSELLLKDEAQRQS
jgi:hypothetical protein